MVFLTVTDRTTARQGNDTAYFMATAFPTRWVCAASPGRILGPTMTERGTGDDGPISAYSDPKAPKEQQYV